MFVAPPIGRIEISSALRFRPRRSASASSATWSLTPSTSTTARESAPVASACAAAATSGVPPPPSASCRSVVWNRRSSFTCLAPDLSRERPESTTSSKASKSGLPGQRLAPFIGHIRDHDLGALLGEPAHGRGAEATSAAGEHGVVPRRHTGRPRAPLRATPHRAVPTRWSAPRATRYLCRPPPTRRIRRA